MEYRRIWSQKPWLLIPALSLTGSVTLGKSLNFIWLPGVAWDYCRESLTTSGAVVVNTFQGNMSQPLLYIDINWSISYFARIFQILHKGDFWPNLGWKNVSPADLVLNRITRDVTFNHLLIHSVVLLNSFRHYNRSRDVQISPLIGLPL